ncbi:hypothetical protein JW905_17105, partial [bacterium]|nr:hypothetical protein [candidate division CSSED10-310 bacterium]
MGNLMKVSLCLVFALLIALPVEAHSILVDGNPADWVMAPPSPPNINVGHIARNPLWQGEYVWSDEP